MRRVMRRVAATAGLCVAWATGKLSAQAAGDPGRQANAESLGAVRTIRGTVIRGSSRGERGLAAQVVVLHRVAATGSGAVDSTVTRRDGTFRIAFRPESAAVYLLSARYAGIGYFSTPLSGDDAADAPAELLVFDTTSVARVARLRGRHVIVSAPDDRGQRAIVEVFELANDSSVTMISTEESSPVWRLHLPGAALEPRVGEGEFAAEAVRFAGGEVQLFAPLPPGMKQLVVSYELPPAAFPLAMLMERASTVLEVLLEEQAGRVEGARLAPQPAVTVGGRRFQRVLAQDVDSAAVVTITLPDVTLPGSEDRWWLVIPVVLLAVVGGWWVASSRPVAAGSTRAAGGVAAPPPVPQTRAALAHRVATLDACLAETAVDAAERARYEAERSRVMAMLREAVSRTRSD